MGLEERRGDERAQDLFEHVVEMRLEDLFPREAGEFVSREVPKVKRDRPGEGTRPRMHIKEDSDGVMADESGERDEGLAGKDRRKKRGNTISREFHLSQAKPRPFRHPLRQRAETVE